MTMTRVPWWDGNVGGEVLWAMLQVREVMMERSNVGTSTKEGSRSRQDPLTSATATTDPYLFFCLARTHGTVSERPLIP